MCGRAAGTIQNAKQTVSNFTRDLVHKHGRVALPDRLKILTIFCRFVVIEILLHAYLEYFLDVVVQSIF